MPSHTVADASASRCDVGGCAPPAPGWRQLNSLDARQTVVVARRRAKRDLVVARDDRVDRRRHELDARRGIGHDLELERRRHVGDRTAGARRQPGVTPRLARLEAALECVIVHAQRKRVAAVAQSNVAQRRRGASRDFDDGSLRNARRFADGKPFGAVCSGTPDRSRASRPRRRTDGRSRVRAPCRSPTGRRSRRSSGRRAAARPRSRRCPCVGSTDTTCVDHASPGTRCDSVIVPRRARRSAAAAVSPRSTAGGRFVKADSRQAACPATRCTGLHDREQAVVEIRDGEGKRRHRDGRSARGLGRAAPDSALLDRREPRCEPARACSRRHQRRAVRARRNRPPPSRRGARPRASTARARWPPRRCRASCAARDGAPSR